MAPYWLTEWLNEWMDCLVDWLIDWLSEWVSGVWRWQTECSEIADNEEKNIKSDVGLGQEDNQRADTFWRWTHQTQSPEQRVRWRTQDLDQHQRRLSTYYMHQQSPNLIRLINRLLHCKLQPLPTIRSERTLETFWLRHNIQFSNCASNPKSFQTVAYLHWSQKTPDTISNVVIGLGPTSDLHYELNDTTTRMISLLHGC